MASHLNPYDLRNLINNPPSTLDEAINSIKKASADPTLRATPIADNPAILLLARHIGRLAMNGPDTPTLRAAILEKIKQQEQEHPLRYFARERMDVFRHNNDAKMLFHSTSRQILLQLAKHLGLQAGNYEYRTCLGGPAVCGESILHSDELYVQVSISCLGLQHDVLYRRVRSRTDYVGEQNHWASLEALLDTQSFAARLIRELQLSNASPSSPDRLL